ncbi:uncharacterized protein PgNI_08947 [Pyricularia grisea]|uniref:Lysine-specific metallo-endopeptidase domain-containing protein n=1 Tax=Pyricularia grisea TaxID=148305 RepID=A0A6P8AUR9_PYRGI|nr:uncharacterized protein PgNI_08947 [Pyricularia grisea]TLD05904.1 hypothetical protein PgNI_08947 [Pyricularia grisea]
MNLLARLGIAAAILSNLVVAYTILPTTDASGANTYDLDERNFELQGPYNKPDVHDPGFDVAAELLKVLPVHQPTNISAWEVGVLPSNCLKYFGSNGRQVQKHDFTVYNSDTSIEKMTTAFGRLPIGMREHVRTVAALPHPPPGERAAAFSTDGDIAVRPRYWDMHTLSHEASHIIDSKLPTAQGHNPYTGRPGALARRYGWRPAPKPSAAAAAATTAQPHLPGAVRKYSDSMRWRGAEEEDERVVSRYALTSWAEHFAETAGVALLEVFGGVGTVDRLSPAAGRGLKRQVGIWVKDWGRVVRGGPETCEEHVRTAQADLVVVG